MGCLFRRLYIYCPFCWSLAMGQALPGTRHSGPRAQESFSSRLFLPLVFHLPNTSISSAPGPGMQSKYGGLCPQVHGG